MNIRQSRPAAGSRARPTWLERAHRIARPLDSIRAGLWLAALAGGAGFGAGVALAPHGQRLMLVALTIVASSCTAVAVASGFARPVPVIEAGDSLPTRVRKRLRRAAAWLLLWGALALTAAVLIFAARALRLAFF